ncbi:MAG TPA: hypothetical protein VGF25_17885 [Thermoleophilaceae bacterium]|jgi:hypothetical protein
MRVGVAIVLVAAVCAALAPAGAEAKACAAIHVNHAEYWVGGAKASCRFMRRWSRSMVKRAGRPRGWDCHRRRYSGGCTKHTGARTEPFFVYYPPD